MSRTVLKLSVRGQWARWALEFMSTVPTPEGSLHVLLEAAGFGRAFFEREGEEGDFAEAFADVVMRLEGTIQEITEKKLSLPVGGMYPKRWIAESIFNTLGERDEILVQSLVQQLRQHDLEQGDACRVASWIFKTEPPLVGERLLFNIWGALWMAK